MPKVTITFQLPEEQSEHNTCINAGKLSSIIHDFTVELRDKVKYGDGKKVHWDDVRELWWSLLQEAKHDPYTD